MASQGSTATQQAAQPQQETPEQRKAREVREEEARREHRHQLIGLFMQDYADEEDHTQTVQPGTATYLAGSLVTKGRTMLIGQAVGTGPIVIDRDMAEKSQGQLRALADADATKGLVRVIENVYWAFYYGESMILSSLPGVYPLSPVPQRLSPGRGG